MAWHDEKHFDAVFKLGTALDYFVDRHFEEWMPDSESEEKVNIQFYYPLIVVQGKLYDIHQQERKVEIKDANYIHFLQSGIYKGNETRYHIDVITESFFSQHLETIEAEMKKTSALLRQRKRDILKSIEAIAALARKAKGKERIAEALKF